MHLKALVPLLLAGVAIAAQSAPLDGPEIGKYLTDLTASLNKLDSLVTQINKDNVGAQLDKIIVESGNMNTMLKSNAAKISGSKAVSGIFGLMPLMSKGQPLLQALNKTVADVMEKRPIVLEAKLQGKVKEGLLASEPGNIALTLALIKNVGPLLQSFSKNGGSGGSATGAPGGGGASGLLSVDEAKLKPFLDSMIDSIMGLYDGSITQEQLAAKAKQAGAPSAAGGAAGTLTSPKSNAPPSPKSTASPSPKPSLSPSPKADAPSAPSPKVDASPSPKPEASPSLAPSAAPSPSPKATPSPKPAPSTPTGPKRMTEESIDGMVAVEFTA